MPMSVGILIFDGFEILDVFGPVELLGLLPEHFEVHLVAERAGAITSAQGPQAVAAHGLEDAVAYDIILVPGGQGTRREVENADIIDWIRNQARQAKFVTSVCTGSGLLARAGILDGRKATTNKMNFSWPVSQGPNVDWVYEARWVEDGNILTSSGVSAGMDMTLALISRAAGHKAAEDAALEAEYTWQRDPAFDPFAAAWKDQHQL